ncbi:hypothetical protein ACHAXH_009674 [Discostella pseudostelligera]
MSLEAQRKLSGCGRRLGIF